MRSPSFIILLLLVLAAPAIAQPAVGDVAGIRAAHLNHIDPLVEAAIDAGRLPGCVVLIGHGDNVVFRRAYGQRQVEPEPEPMTLDTVFDLASLTKPIATATSVMILVERGQVRLRDPVAKYIPEFAANDKDAITVEQLLTHQGGLIPDNPLADYQDGEQLAWERIFALQPTVEPGTKFMYTDVGFLVLGDLVRRVTGQNVHEFSHENIFRPLGMTETGYQPPKPLRRRAATNEQREGHWMRGEVHDPRAYLLGGVAGHAGLFSTAHDLSLYARMMLHGGRLGDVRVLGPKTVEEMTTARDVAGNLRALGWDKQSVYSRNRGELFTPAAFGHGGFTGTAIWIDPGLDLYVIFLANRLHPDGEGEVNDLAGRIGTIAAAALVPADESSRTDHATPAASIEHGPDTRSVLTGIDVLVRDGFAQLAGRRVGLITNHTGVDQHGHRTARLLSDAANVDLVALFSPEHGIAGKLDVATIPDQRDAETGVPIYSLYGKTRKPLAKQLADVDTLVFDVQDIGTRFYTYISTMGMAMEAADDAGRRFVVLDRPNPIGGNVVAGPLLDTDRKSFVAFHCLPVRHGMTVGELAQMFRHERRLSLDLEVVRVENWRRGDMWDVTGLVWINPSPNMRSLAEAVLYPGIGLLETTNLSVGRGTDTPFEVVGAPWLDGRRLAASLNDTDLPGVRFVPIRFTPTASKHAGHECRGINIIVTDRSRFQSVRTGLEIAVALRKLHPDDWNMRPYLRLLGNQRAYDALAAGASAAEIETTFHNDLKSFLARREEFLLY